MRKKKKVARRDENLSGLMNFISFNLDNGVEVKSRRRRCRLCRMWPVLYARSQLSRQSRKIKVSEFHVDARENGENLKSVCVLVVVVCVNARELWTVRWPELFKRKRWNDHRHATHYGVVRKGNSQQRHQKGCESAFKFSLSAPVWTRECITSNIQHISAQ